MRFACLYVADFALAALLRCDPELRGSAVAVVDRLEPRSKLLAVSPAAARRGVRCGLSVTQAKAIDAELILRCVSSDMRRAAQAALCDVAGSFSPRIEDSGDGVVYLDLGGLGSLFESEGQLATALSQRALQLGLDAQVGVASSKIAAWLAARQGGGVAVIPNGEEWSFLAPVAVSLLAPSPNLAATLQRWGIQTIGALAALPTPAVGTRLGPEGVLLVRRARGEDDVPLLPRLLPMNFEESFDLDYGVDNLEPFLFILRALLDRLTARLAMRGFLCGDLRLGLHLAGRGRDDRTITVTAPSNDVKALLMLVRLQLEAHPPAAAIQAAHVVALPEKLRAAQLDLFRPNGPAPAQLAVTLARLTAICGADRVGEPMVADSHRPEAYGVATFQSKPGARSWELGANDFSQTPGSQLPAPRCPFPALRAVRPAQPIEVFCQRDRPDFIRGPRFAGRVVQAAGPWRLHGDWWSESAYARDYYDVQLSDGGVYRVYREAIDERWFVEGEYD